jgi:hypothetical protein
VNFRRAPSVPKRRPAHRRSQMTLGAPVRSDVRTDQVFSQWLSVLDLEQVLLASTVNTS